MLKPNQIFLLVQSLTKDSFREAGSVETLVLRSLDHINRFDYDSLSHMTFLRELHMNTFPAIEKYRSVVTVLMMWITQ